MARHIRETRHDHIRPFTPCNVLRLYLKTLGRIRTSRRSFIRGSLYHYDMLAGIFCCFYLTSWGVNNSHNDYTEYCTVSRITVIKLITQLFAYFLVSYTHPIIGFIQNIYWFGLNILHHWYIFSIVIIMTILVNI